jgi:hypothetical protein
MSVLVDERNKKVTATALNPLNPSYDLMPNVIISTTLFPTFLRVLTSDFPSSEALLEGSAP